MDHDCWWLIVIELKDHRVVKYASIGYNRVNAKFNAENSKDYHEWISKHGSEIQSIGIVASNKSYPNKGFI